jgi:hypothetical protein
MPHRAELKKRLPKDAPDFIADLLRQLSFVASGRVVCIHSATIQLKTPLKWIKKADFNFCKQKCLVSNTIRYYLNTYTFGRLHGTLPSHYDVR